MKTKGKKSKFLKAEHPMCHLAEDVNTEKGWGEAFDAYNELSSISGATVKTGDVNISSSRIRCKDWMRKSITCPIQCLAQGKNSINDSYLNFTNPLLFWREKLSWLEGHRDSISFLIVKVLIKIKLHAVKGHAQQPKAKVKILVKVWGLSEMHKYTL